MIGQHQCEVIINGENIESPVCSESHAVCTGVIAKTFPSLGAACASDQSSRVLFWSVSGEKRMGGHVLQLSSCRILG